jgi:TonB family protein
MTRLHRAAALSAFTLATFGLVITSASALPLFAQQQQGDEDIVKPKLVKKVTPHYPPAAKESRTQGKVVLDVTVGKDGKVVNVTVKDGDAVLAEAAVEAVKDWEYEPARKKGEPVECMITVDVNFTLTA